MLIVLSLFLIQLYDYGFYYSDSRHDETVRQVLDYVLKDGEMPALTQREMLHLQDVRDLVRSGLRFYVFLAAAGAALAWAGRENLAHRTGCATIILVMLCTAVMLFFDQAFVGLHRLIFKNDLWMLSPDKHILIVLFPRDLYIRFAARVLAMSAAAGIVLIAMGRLMRGRGSGRARSPGL